MRKKLFLALMLVSIVVFAQEKPREGKEKNAVLHEVSNKDVVQSIYPDAAKVEKVNDYWYKVFDAQNQVVGFAMSSATYCQNIKGYNDLTPVMIITDKTWVIKKVALLSNWETPGYVRRLDRKGFFNSWVGKTLKEAKTLEVDAHTGATYTALAVVKNVEFLLNKGAKKLPKIK